jgi:hypothetical protein
MPPQKKLLAGGRGDEMIRNYLPGNQQKQGNNHFNKIPGGRGKEAIYNRF